MVRNRLIAAAALLTLAGFLSPLAYSPAVEQDRVQGNEVAANWVASAWRYYGLYYKPKAERIAANLRRQGYSTKLVYDRGTDSYEVWYR